MVRELPVKLTNINNVEYTSDGRLFAAGYDGRLHVLRDLDGDGLEEQVTTFFGERSGDYPLGIAVRGDSLYVVRRRQIVRHRDTDGDGVPDSVEVAATWNEAEVDPAFRDDRRVAGGIGLAVGPDGSFYIGLGSLNTFKPYMLLGAGGKEPKPYSTAAAGTKSTYDLRHPHGVILKISADGKAREIMSTGVRYPVSLQFNRRGDLFCTDQEGATWLPNGNPFDELLHLRTGRHYGFPPRHPRHLPAVVDEPSTFDYAPQHQSTCGFRFNEPVGGAGKGFGPADWAGDALVTGESRGKLFRTRLVGTPSGYVAANQVLACLNMLPVDDSLSPKGDLVLACHGGDPDWGSGPAGPGRLFKLSFPDPTAPTPSAVWAASATETRIAFDAPLTLADWSSLRKETVVEAGRYVAAGDRFETVRPGYAVVDAQQKAGRRSLEVLSGALSPDARTLLIRTKPRQDAVKYSVTLPTPPRPAVESTHTLARAGGTDLGLELTGVAATWNGRDGRRWEGWLPHPDWLVAKGLTTGSSEHEALRADVSSPGTLTVTGQLDLASMLRPATQPGSKRDYELPAETVTVTFASDRELSLSAGKPAVVRVARGKAVRLQVENPERDRWVTFSLTAETAGEPKIDVSWVTNEDDRPRPLPTRRVLLPWAKPAGSPVVPAVAPEIEGGDWQAGRKLFFGETVGCAKCHTMRGEGGAVGPDLSNLVHRDFASVAKDIREPSAALNPDFLSYTVELDDGRTLVGVMGGSTADAVSVTDGTGKAMVVHRKHVLSVTPSKVSVMPEKLLESLSATQTRDLMTFLLRDSPR